jgi:4-hydroxy-2-oxoglutarate aldolase
MSPHNNQLTHGDFTDHFNNIALGQSTAYPQPHRNSLDSLSATFESDEELGVSRPLVAGVYVPTFAFFDPDTENLDVGLIASHAVRLAEAGVAGLATQGSNGEAVNLTQTERKIVTRTTRKALDDAGFLYTPIIVGCGAQSTRETIELCNDAYLNGGDYALVLPPAYYRGLYKPETIYEFFVDVADHSPIPILLYNFPGGASGIDLDSDIIIRLSQHPNIVGTKLTCGNVGKLNRVAASPAALDGSFKVFGGSADFTLQTIVGGGVGIIAGLANLAPKACVKTINMFLSGNIKEAKRLQAIVARGDWCAIQSGVVGSKSAMNSFYGYGGHCRRPLPRPTAEDVSKYKRGFAELMELEKSLA